MMSSSKNKKVLNLHAVGVDDRSRNALQLYFQHNCKNTCKLVEENSAEIFLVDMDGYGAETRYESLRSRYPNHPMILMSLSPQKGSDHHFLQKPISINQLQSVLEKIAIDKKLVDRIDATPAKEKTVSQTGESSSANQRPAGYAAQLLSEQELLSFVGSGADIDINSPQQLSSIFFNPTNLLLGKLHQAWREATERQSVVRVVGLWRPITLFPATGEVHVELSDRQLQSVCVVSVGADGGGIDVADVKLEPVDGAEAASLARQGQHQDMESFLWKVALWTSRGRVPVGIELDKPVYLRAWPNFTRLVVTPHALRIAACLLRQPRCLIDLAEVLQIPQRYVFSFFTAANLAGLAGQAKRSSDIIVEPPKVQRSSRTGLLSRILKSLVR